MKKFILIFLIAVIALLVAGCTGTKMPALGCKDSDNGKVAAIKGYTSYEGKTVEDFCAHNKAVVEYYCDEHGINVDKIKCWRECDDGRCK